MANLCPSDLTALALSGGHRAELATLDALKRGLSTAYTVFHNVHWTRESARTTAFGEIDFVVVNRAGEVLVIEQKSGALEETDQGLIKRYDNGHSRNPIDQLHRSIGAIRGKFSYQNRGRGLVIDYLVYCPHHRLSRIIASGLDKSRVVDAVDADRLAARIAALLAPGSEAEAIWGERVSDFFAQAFDLIPDIHAYGSAQERSFIRLTGGLLRFIDAIEMKPLRLRVRGTAGSGKTVIAAYMFERARDEGGRPLLVCYNRPLADHLAAKLRKTEDPAVFTWNALCARFLESRGHQLDFERVREGPPFWREVEERVVAEPIPPNWQFDRIIVDEGQDFEPEWVDILQCFATPEAGWVWLEDPDQAVRPTASVTLTGFVGLRLEANYRTPQSIARFIRRALAVELDCANDLPGLGVHVATWEIEDDQLRLAAARVQTLLRMGFELQHIVILSLHGLNSSCFAQTEQLGKIPLARFTGQYHPDGRQLMSPGKLRFESAGRFKGQEAPAVIVVDVDDMTTDSEHGRARFFTALTRATVRLEVLAKNGDRIADTVVAAARI
jgi:hypothetical protein